MAIGVYVLQSTVCACSVYFEFYLWNKIILRCDFNSTTSFSKFIVDFTCQLLSIYSSALVEMDKFTLSVLSNE